eukprot:NODE_1627_length_1465_cov_63.043785_g1469_i0.p1 GENE.NODE_1627_length_1465_cov_63.043785_g1469_i0~~NODE_1627_length_1465_cov_63.043785_g1469_i0.p1  ORF type:complete len:341 (+),score=91.14 NODE_1627_length_1465_cov_63.043785_g1469_i0:76-1098(+)
MAKQIFGMGNPLLDISADVTGDVLEKYGLKPANAILAEEKHLPLYKELAELPDVQYIPGGATLNSIRVADWMLQGKKEGSTYYVGCIGNDKFGDIMKEKSEQSGLVVPMMRTDKQPTGTCAVLITGKERSLVANLAAANCFEESHMDTAAVQEAVKNASIYYISGFFLTVSVPSILRVGKHAGEENKTFCMNLSAPFVIEFFGSQLHEALPYVDILFSNEDEARQFAKSNNIESTDVKEIAQKVVSLPKINSKQGRIVVFTQGKDPTVVATAAGVTEYPVPPVPADKIIDTNGAGDAFVGGFLSRLALGEDIESCVRAGNYAAGVIIQHSGCTYPEKPEY